MRKIDITSTAIEKGIDSAKEFLDKLIGPTVEETGLLLKDKITFWRFKNQVKMINKAQKYCESNQINPKSIPLKMLHPIMEYSAIEEAEELQDKWAILLSNMVDSEQNIENHVFPYILSQISVMEFQIVECYVIERFKLRKKLSEELEVELANSGPKRTELEEKIGEIEAKLEDIPADVSWQEKYQRRRDLYSLRGELRSLNYQSIRLNARIKAPIQIDEGELEEFEFSNLRRLGLIKGLSKQVASVESSDFSLDIENESISLEDLDILIQHDYEEYVVTQLGEIFIDVCTEKKEKSI